MARVRISIPPLAWASPQSPIRGPRPPQQCQMVWELGAEDMNKNRDLLLSFKNKVSHTIWAGDSECCDSLAPVPEGQEPCEPTPAATPRTTTTPWVVPHFFHQITSALFYDIECPVLEMWM